MRACVSIICVDATVIAELAIRWDEKSPRKTMMYKPNMTCQQALVTHQRKYELTFQHHSTWIEVRAKSPALLHEGMSKCIPEVKTSDNLSLSSLIVAYRFLKTLIDGQANAYRSRKNHIQ
jgi:hypothetical protein